MFTDNGSFDETKLASNRIEFLQRLVKNLTEEEAIELDKQLVKQTEEIFEKMSTSPEGTPVEVWRAAGLCYMRDNVEFALMSMSQQASSVH